MLTQHSAQSLVIPAGTPVPDTSQQSHLHSAFVLFEVPQSFIKDLHTLTIRGTNNPVLSTKDRTCSIRQADTSNLLLLVIETDTLTKTDTQVVSPAYQSIQSNKLPDNVCEVLDIGSSYYEALEIRPTPEILIDLLQSHPYKGESGKTDTTMKHLLDIVPASEKEILMFLEQLQAVEIEGIIRFNG
jgi:hypothetical protein